ncbi:hypothetical protein J6590_009443 [Homalodisca vitripennis]|nr:hypothetical protein J6590_009443 [Homalodisca vitripennis]
MKETTDQRICIKVCFNVSKNCTEMIESTGTTQIKEWYRRMKNGHTPVDRDPCCGRPSLSTPENIKCLQLAIKDELTRDLELGVCYNVVVSFKPHHMVAWGIERTISEHQWRFTNGLPTVAIPLAILQHLQKTDLDSPWNLTATLSSQLASHIYPLNSFFQLKIGLLLSLASQVQLKI